MNAVRSGTSKTRKEFLFIHCLIAMLVGVFPKVDSALLRFPALLWSRRVETNCCSLTAVPGAAVSLHDHRTFGLSTFSPGGLSDS